MNVLMIVSDTVRQDYFGINGGRAWTPNLDALARESVYFRRAYANSFPTMPTRADYLTGQFALTDIGWGPLPQGITTFPQVLAADGVTTVGVVDTPFYVRQAYNYDRGFEYFYDLPTQFRVLQTLMGDGLKNDIGGGDLLFAKGAALEPFNPQSEDDYCAPLTMATAERALERLVGERFFLLVDTWDPHEPWNPPPHYVTRYKSDYDGRVIHPPYGPYAERGISEEDLETGIACYCAELEMVDQWIGRLLSRLESLRLADDTAVIFASDHGYYFGEHGFFGKMTKSPSNASWLRSPLYPEVCHVPLMMRVPGVAPRSENRVVSSAINVAPTVIDLFGLEKPEQMLGRSLLPLVRSAEAAADEIAITAMPLSSPGDSARVVDDVLRRVDVWQPVTVHTEEWTMLFSRWEDPIELYAVVDGNPHTLGPNLADERPEVVKELHAKLIAELTRAGASEQAIAARS